MSGLNSVLDLLYRQRYVAIGTLLVGLVATFFFIRAIPREFQGVAQVLVVNEGGHDPSVDASDLPLVATSSLVLSRVKDSLNLPTELVEMKKRLTAKVNGRSTIMQIAYEDESPDRAVLVTNSIADELTRYYHEVSTSRYDLDVRNLDAALESQRKRLTQISRRIDVATSKDPFVASDKAIDLVTGRLDDLEVQRSLASAALAGDLADARAASGDPNLVAKTARYEILQGDPRYKALVDGASKDGADLAFQRAEFKSTYPGLPNLVAKVLAERAELKDARREALTSPDAYSASEAKVSSDRAKAEAIVTADQAKVASLDQLVAVERQRLKDIRVSDAVNGTLRTDRDIAEADYMSISARRATALANRAEALSLGGIVVLDRAIRADTQLPGGRLRTAITAAIFILALSLALAYLAESLDHRLRRSRQVESLYGGPVIANLGSQE